MKRGSEEGFIHDVDRSVGNELLHVLHGLSVLLETGQHLCAISGRPCRILGGRFGFVQGSGGGGLTTGSQSGLTTTVAVVFTVHPSLSLSLPI